MKCAKILGCGLARQINLVIPKGSFMIPLYTILVLAAMLMQAFFSSSEMAFTSMNKIKLRKLVDSGDKQAFKLYNLFKKEGAYLGTTLVGTNIAQVISSTLAARIFAEYFSLKISPIITTCIMVPLTLIFAEIIPKVMAHQFSTPFALNAIMPINNFYRLFYPLIMIVDFMARTILSPFNKFRLGKRWTFTKADLKKIIILGSQTGEVEEDEAVLIHKVLDFETKKVEKIMVPLYKVSSIELNDKIENLKDLVSLTGFSRIPVYKKNKNDILGIVNIYDILFAKEKLPDKMEIKDFIREAVYIKNDDGLDIALTRLRHKKQPMGIVSDSDNRVVGIITIEDMLEEIVGEIGD